MSADRLSITLKQSMKSLFSAPALCTALDVEQPYSETAITQKRLATFIVVANRSLYGLLTIEPRPRCDRRRKRDTVDDQAEGERREQPVE